MDEAAFAAFYEATYRSVRGYVMKSVGEAAVADDITQEAYVRLLQAEKRGWAASDAKAYLYRIATNLMHDRWRRGGREVQESETGERERSHAAPDPKRDLGLDVSAAFEQLAQGQKMLLWLAYVEGYGHRDIARAMNIREKSVRVMLSRARGRLRELFRRAGIESEDAP
jgi:RNA polymerase sigma-70 factor (ECF subfamily)